MFRLSGLFLCRSVNRSVNQSINRSVNHSINQSINQSINHFKRLSSNAAASRVKHPQASSTQSINQSINHPIIGHIEQPLYIDELYTQTPITGESINQPVNQSINQPTNQSTNQSINQSLSALFTFRRMSGPLNDREISDFHRDGYLIKRSFYSPSECDLMLAESLENQSINENRIDVPDSDGRLSKMTVWNTLSNHRDDLFSLIGSGERLVKAMEQVLGDEVYHYHSKLMIKEPKVGGKWEWHQDYGYWYMNGCLTSRMCSGLISINSSTRENGCLQVLKGSHFLGRIEHGVVGGQTGADQSIIDWLISRHHCELIHVECEPGDVLLFHSNLLHCSAPNLSDKSRISLICCYNARSNDPIRSSHHPNYQPINQSSDDALMEYAERVKNGQVDRLGVEKARREAYLDPEKDQTTPGSRKGNAN